MALADPEQMALLKKAKPRKYRNEPFWADGLYWDSKKEHARWVWLKTMEDVGAISKLTVHVPYRLVVKGHHIATYEADFVYTQDEMTVVEDVKGFRTKEYQLKKKLMFAVHGVTIKET